METTTVLRGVWDLITAEALLELSRVPSAITEALLETTEQVVAAVQGPQGQLTALPWARTLVLQPKLTINSWLVNTALLLPIRSCSRWLLRTLVMPPLLHLTFLALPLLLLELPTLSMEQQPLPELQPREAEVATLLTSQGLLPQVR